MRIAIGLLAAVSLSALALATTWTRDDQDDPFSDGQCVASNPMSYGSYIYQWPSKYELVFWPYTDPAWVWFCPESGYVAFGSNFEVEEAERQRVGLLLAENRTAWQVSDWPRVNDNNAVYGWSEHDGILAALEAIARVRDGTDWAFMNRVLAQWHLQDRDEADTYRREALALIDAGLAEKTGLERAEALYLSGAYHFWFGNPALAEARFAEIATLEWTNDDGQPQTGMPYLEALAAEVLDGALDEQWGAMADEPE